jgi:TnpA family transposase
LSGRYGPSHPKWSQRDDERGSYILGGLHHQAHQTDLRITEHYTDTAGATDHVFGLCHLLGFRFAPRIKDLKDRKLYTIDKPSTYPLLEPLIGDVIETAAITSQWAELLRLKASIQAGVVVPSVILRKLAAAGVGNSLSRAVRALGRIVAPLGWEHIALTGDYVWTDSRAITGFRPIRDVPAAFLSRAA